MRINNIHTQSFGYKLSRRYAAKLIEDNGIDKGIDKINELRNKGNDNFEIFYIPETNKSKEVFIYAIPHYELERKYNRHMNPELIEKSMIKSFIKRNELKAVPKSLIKDFPHLKKTMQDSCI